jgi:hypothetical protein
MWLVGEFFKEGGALTAIGGLDIADSDTKDAFLRRALARHTFIEAGAAIAVFNALLAGRNCAFAVSGTPNAALPPPAFITTFLEIAFVATEQDAQSNHLEPRAMHCTAGTPRPPLAGFIDKAVELAKEAMASIFKSEPPPPLQPAEAVAVQAHTQR